MQHRRDAIKSTICVVLCAVSVLFYSILSLGQIPSGQIHLEIQDPSGVPTEASGRLVHSGVPDRNFQTEQGQYIFRDLPAGSYRLEVSKAGFATQALSIDLQAGGAVTRTVTLALAPQASKIDVVAVTPLAGTDVFVDDIPSSVQTASALDLDRTGALDLSDLLGRKLSGVHINANQENPFQPDVNYRGYTASPLLGTPEGISVYMDGVRQNQPFGDVVAWDLIPKIAISEIALIPGSNPLFGLNTLGGALSIETKDGRSQPGASLQLSGGSFGRREGALEYGGASARRGLSWYFAGDLLREDGWRQFSPSEVRQSFGKLGWTGGKTSANLSFGYANNWLTGNGLQDTRFLAQHYSSVNTIPDITWNHSPSFNLSLHHIATSKLTFSGNAYFRFIRANTTNGDINEASFDQSIYNLSAADIAGLTAAGYKGFPITGNATTEPFPFWRCIAQGLEKDEASEKCTGLITNTANRQHNYGLSGQAGWLASRHHITMGSAWDRSSLGFQQASQFAYLDPDRLTFTAINAFADGSTNQNGVPVDTRVNLQGHVNTVSFYATDTFSLAPSLTLTLSGRYNRTSIDNADRLPPVTDGSRGSLNGRYVFDRFNTAAGFTYTPARFGSIYFNYSESSRAPTAIELGCADPNQPCNLPNALVGDPPLNQVVTRTVEAGIRGTMENILNWSVNWFRGQNDNDLLFVASQQTGFGYFTNFGQTRRQGIEVDVRSKLRKVTVGGNYTLLNATYQSPQLVGGSSNSLSDGGLGLDGNISVQPGDRIPLVPQNIFKAFADYQPTSKLSVDLDFDAIGRSFARGNENNLHQPDGIYYLGQGFSPGYGVLNAGAHYQLQKRTQLFIQVNNVANHRYYTAAQLAPTPYDNAGNFIARPFPSVGGDFPVRHTTFVAPGAPVGAWAGIRVRF
jgi:outer membrane receptor protein involved in Fe transport